MSICRVRRVVGRTLEEGTFGDGYVGDERYQVEVLQLERYEMRVLDLRLRCCDRWSMLDVEGSV